MAELPEELGIEVEALEHLYGLDAFTISSRGVFTTLSMALLPRQLDGDHEAYVAAKLVLRIENSSYPTSPATAILEDAKGLTDTACTQLQASLQAEAVNLAGEMVLGHLCELALDLLTEANHPNGTCIFCLEDLVISHPSSSAATDSSTSGAYQVLKLPCFHCFHTPCFTAWFQWQQAAAAAAAAEPAAPVAAGQRPTSPSGQDVECEDGWIARKVFTIKCPSCRLEVPPSALRHALPRLLGASRNPGNLNLKQTATQPQSTTTTKNFNTSSSVAVWSAEHPKAKDVLSPESLHQLIEMQRAFKRVLDLQKACGGLVQENVAVSVAELEAAAAEKRQQQQQQQEQKQQQQGLNAEHGSQKEGVSAPHTAGRTGGGRGGGGRGQNHSQRGGSRDRGRSSGSRGRASGRGNRSTTL